MFDRVVYTPLHIWKCKKERIKTETGKNARKKKQRQKKDKDEKK